MRRVGKTKCGKAALLATLRLTTKQVMKVTTMRRRKMTELPNKLVWVELVVLIQLTLGLCRCLHRCQQFKIHCG